MNREILFRGKRTDNGEWVEGYLCECHHKDTGKYDYAIQEMFENGYIMHEVIPETVGQYTGLTDNNGKKIFEGDILGAHLDVNYPEDETIAVIVWANNAWCIQELGAEPDIIGDDELKNDGWEIIGNIHDNPELMEVQHE